MTSVLFVWFLLYLCEVNSFTKLPTRNRLLPIPLSTNSLESIVSSRAVLSSLTTRLQQEFIGDNTLMSELIHRRVNIPLDVFYLLLFASSIYLRMNYISKFDKLEKFEAFSKSRRLTNSVFVVVTVLLIKNVDIVL